MKELLLIIVIIMVMQFITGVFHIKYYQSVLRKMSKQSEGFLGVGMNQSKMKMGQVCILVTDVEGKITECRMLTGLTVFSRFRKAQTYVGNNIFHMMWSEKEKNKEIIEVAIDMIKKEMQKRESAVLDAMEA